MDVLHTGQNIFDVIKVITPPFRRDRFLSTLNYSF